MTDAMPLDEAIKEYASRLSDPEKIERLRYALHSIMTELEMSSGRPSAIAQERARQALKDTE